jgi:hypothetical protein
MRMIRFSMDWFDMGFSQKRVYNLGKSEAQTWEQVLGTKWGRAG